MWQLDHKEGWAPKNWCFWIVVLEKTLESPLDNKEIKPVNPKGNQPWRFIRKSDAEAPILWAPAAKRSNQSILKEINPEYSLEGLMLKLQYFGHLTPRANSLEKTLMLGKSEGKRRRGKQDEMAGWHHWLNGHEFEQAPGVGDGQRGLVCCSPWGCKKLDMTYWLNNNSLL